METKHILRIEKLLTGYMIAATSRVFLSYISWVINRLKPNEIFVFGSNLGGRHAGGAARLAKEKFGAQEGVGEGLTGQSYAFPTLTARFERVSQASLEASRDRFFDTVLAHSDKIFLLTKVGCGIAGFAEGEIRPLFKNAPPNVVLPEDWR